MFSQKWHFTGRWGKTTVHNGSNLFLKILTDGAEPTEAYSLDDGFYLGVSYKGYREWEKEKQAGFYLY